MQAKVRAMGLLAQLFRHKSASPGDTTPAPQPVVPEDGGNVRGVGAIAAAAGVKTEHGMPEEFALSLGELLARVPQHCVWPGRHDAGRVLRIPAADVVPGLARGKAELSLARLVALAPEVFRWERGESDDPQVRLPIQKLLQQIRNDKPLPLLPMAPLSSSAETVAERTPPMRRDMGAGDFTGDVKIITEQLPSIIWEKPEASIVLPDAEVISPPSPADPAVENEHPPADPKTAPETEMPPPAVKPPPGVPEVRPTISVSATEPHDRPVELRPLKDGSISTTLRAVVLGGIAPAASANAPVPTRQILAPRVALAMPGALPSVILGPSVVPSANDGGVSLARRTEPDFAGLQNLFMTGAALDLAGVAALAAALPGVRACVISGAAGSATAGDFSHGVNADQVRTASADLARIGGAATEILHRGQSDIALFLHDEVCLAAIVAPGSFVPGVRERLARVAELLAGATPAR